MDNPGGSGLQVGRPSGCSAPMSQMLKSSGAVGLATIISRAVDTLGNSQPLDGTIDWNPAGYVWHGADRVTVQVNST